MLLPPKILLCLPVFLCILGSLAFADELAGYAGGANGEIPLGSRQRCYRGKPWPLEPRPTGRRAPFIHGYHASLYWPNPYTWEDRGAVREVLAAQRNNGWVTATTLYGQHFDPVTNELNQAGKVQLRWILLHTPPGRRFTWVEAGPDAEISSTRLASTQEEATLIAGSTPCPVMLRVCQPTGTAADEVDSIRRSYLASIPVPRVPYVPLSGGSGGGAPSGGGGSGGGTPQAGAAR